MALSYQSTSSSLETLLAESVEKTIQNFESKLQTDGSLGYEAADIACYFKLPMMFIAAGKMESARKVMGYIKTRFLLPDGDFGNSASIKSIKPEYIEYWSYINGWILRAANILEMTDVSRPASAYMKRYTGFSDVLTAAHHGLIALEAGEMKDAPSAGDYLCAAIHDQPDLNKGFYLRFENKKAVTAFASEQTPFYFVSKTEPNQLHFMIGYPAAFLALLYQETRDEKYLAAAKQYLDFSLSSHESVYACGFSHKTAWAASILFALTEEAQYLHAVEKISNYLVSNQAANGLWYADADVNTSLDQSAEIAGWFLEIGRYLNNKPIPDVVLRSIP